MSVDISRGQYLLLKKFRKDNISAESLDKKQLDDCDYLVKCGFLKAIKELKLYEADLAPFQRLLLLQPQLLGALPFILLKQPFTNGGYPSLFLLLPLVFLLLRYSLRTLL